MISLRGFFAGLNRFFGHPLPQPLAFCSGGEGWHLLCCGVPPLSPQPPFHPRRGGKGEPHLVVSRRLRGYERCFRAVVSHHGPGLTLEGLRRGLVVKAGGYACQWLRTYLFEVTPNAGAGRGVPAQF